MKTKYNSTLSAAEAKGGDQTLNKTIRRRGFGVGLVGLLAVLVLVLLPSLVEAQEPCRRWDVSGQWSFKQSNQGALNQMDLRQDGINFTGTASYQKGKGVMRGSVDGDVSTRGRRGPAEFFMMIYWENGLVGVYKGQVEKYRGRIEGEGWERRSPSIKVTWFSNRVMKCLERYPK